MESIVKLKTSFFFINMYNMNDYTIGTFITSTYTQNEDDKFKLSECLLNLQEK